MATFNTSYAQNLYSHYWFSHIVLNMLNVNSENLVFLVHPMIKMCILATDSHFVVKINSENLFRHQDNTSSYDLSLRFHNTCTETVKR